MINKETVVSIIEAGLKNCEYNWSIEDVWYSIINIYLKETSNSRYEENIA